MKKKWESPPPGISTSLNVLLSLLVLFGCSGMATKGSMLIHVLHTDVDLNLRRLVKHT